MIAGSRRWFSLITLLVLTWVAHFFIDAMLGIWPVYKSLASINLATAGLIVAIGAFIGEGSQLFFGPLSDKGYRKTLIIVGLFATLGSAFLAYSTHYGVLFGLYLLTCLGSGCFHPAAASLMGSLIPAHRGLLLTIFASGGSLGLATSQMIFTHTYDYFNGHTYILAVPGAVLAFFLIFYRISKIPGASTINHKVGLSDFREFLKKPTLRYLYFSQIANQSLLWGTIFILPDVLKEMGHADWICYGGGHLCFILGGTCTMIPAGYLADIYSARQVLLYAGIISCVSLYFILFTGGISMTIVLIALFVLGASLGLVNPVGLALGSRLEPNRTGAISAFLMGLVWCLSEAIGPGGVGLMSTLFSDYAPVKALAILGSLFLVQIYATFRLPKAVPVAATA